MLPAPTTTLVLVHGFALDARMWRKQVDEFAPDHRILSIDLPGFGPQARDVGEVDPAAEILRAMNAARVKKAHLVAFAYGAQAATDLVLRLPERIASLTLVSPQMLGRKLQLESWDRCVSLAEEGDHTTAAEIWMDDPLFESLRESEELFEEVRQIVLDYNGGHWTGHVKDTFAIQEPQKRLKEIQAPALVVSGEADLPSFMLMAEAYARGIKRSRREIIQGCGHNVTFEAPEALSAILRDFLSTL